MNKKELIKKIEAEAKKYFVGASGCHDWTHVERVRALAMRIGKKEKVDPFVVEAAALLHDIGRKEELESKKKFCHAEKGSETTGEILKKLKIDGDIAENIIHSVRTHRFRGHNVPKTLEAKVLFDADKIDSIGAVGIGRIFLFAGSPHGSGKLHSGRERELIKTGKDYSFTEEDTAAMEYYKKLIKIKNKILTASGKKLAKERHAFMVEFFKRMEKEVEGKL